MNTKIFKKLTDFWQGEISDNLIDAWNDVKTKFVEMFDLHAILRPHGSQKGYHVNLMANILLKCKVINQEHMI